MTDIRNAHPIGEPIDDSGGFCCVSAGMHMGHDEGCPGYPCPECGGAGVFRDVQTGEVTHDMALDACEPSMEGQPIFEDVPCSFCGGGGRV